MNMVLAFVVKTLFRNVLVAAIIGTALFALHVNTDRHVDPHMHENIRTPVWTTASK